jgi:DNA-binding HxlR family transcriptional regulator
MPVFDLAARGHFEVPSFRWKEPMKKSVASYVERDRCPLYTAIKIIAGRWKPMIFQRLGEGALGFGQLRRSMPGVTVKVLRQQLRQLEADGLVKRSTSTRPGLRVRYELTPHGQTLGPVSQALCAWGVIHLARTKGPGKAEGDTSRHA